ncbi:MAG TPA: ornithine cyclodeaminase family protein [Gemmatimonadales bacterium]|nr:ornithine cyclodeaminase family protein [Gemmatimonadales bacterium]
MDPEGTLILTRRDVVALLRLPECIDAVERAFRLHAEGRALPPGVLGVPARDGGFHVKAAGLELGRPYFAAKVNGNFFRNRERFGLANIQGVIVLCDAENGSVLALLDSIEITTLRTGAATAVAARHLARPDSRVAAICGCGNQGRVQLRALKQVRPIERVAAFDTDAARARAFAAELSPELGIEIHAAPSVDAAVKESDIVVTCTPARRYFLTREHIRPGTFVAGVGADNEDKQELDPALLASSTVVVDVLDQCATIGDLHHALAQGTMTRAQVHAELADIVSGKKPGRTAAGETIVFDSTGTALQDVAAAALVFEKARRAARGLTVQLGA